MNNDHRCPRCGAAMTARTVSPDDCPTATTTWLCPSCFARDTTQSPNPRYLVPPTQSDAIVFNEHPSRRPLPGKRSLYPQRAARDARARLLDEIDARDALLRRERTQDAAVNDNDPLTSPEGPL